MKDFVVSDVLEKSKDKIVDINNWCKNANAKDIQNMAIGFNSPEACRFCASGAIMRVLFDEKIATYSELSYTAIPIPIRIVMHLALNESNYLSIVDVNDLMGHDETIKLFDKMIAIAKEKESQPAPILVQGESSDETNNDQPF